MRFIFLFFLIPLLLFTSCKEEKIYPNVEVTAPARGSVFNYGDTILVTAEIEDGVGTPRVDVLLGDRLMGLPNELVEKRGQSFSFFVYLNDKYLLSRNYSIRVVAKSKNAENSGFSKVYIHELPKTLESIGWLSTISDNTFQLKTIDYNTAISQIKMYSGSTGDLSHYAQEELWTLVEDNNAVHYLTVDSLNQEVYIDKVM